MTGAWNEWHLRFDDDTSGWLSDAQAEYEKLNEMLNLQRHLLKANWVWSLPKLPACAMRAVASRLQGHGKRVTGNHRAN